MENNTNPYGDVLFEAVCPENYNDSFRFHIFTLTKSMKGILIFIAVMIFIDFLFQLSNILRGEKTDFSAIVLTVFILPVFEYLYVKKFTKDSLAAPIHCSNVNRFVFYQNCFEIFDNYSRVTLPYNMLVESYETKEYFYLFIEKNRAFIIGKYGFTYNTPEEMRKLLTIKLGNRFIVKTK